MTDLNVVTVYVFFNNCCHLKRLLCGGLTEIRTDLQNGYLQTHNENLSEIPIPDPTSAERTALEGQVDRILKAKQANAEADVSALEREIHDRVYRPYGLTPEEIAIVKKSTRS